MADFSNVTATTAAMVARRIERGGSVSDEMLLEAAERVRPLLLPKDYMAALRKELDPEAVRRGRPSHNGLTRADVAEKLTALRSRKIPRMFIDRLAERMRSGERFTEFDREVTSYRAGLARTRRMFTKYFSEFFRGKTEPGGGTIAHPILGPITVATSERFPRKRELEFVHAALRRTGFDPPSVDRLANILSSSAK